MLFVTVVTMLFTSPVMAQTSDRGSVICPGGEQPKIDLTCQRQKLLDPNYPCVVSYCGDTNPNSIDSDVVDLNVFGTRIRLNSDVALARVIMFVFNALLGIGAIAAAGLGLAAAARRAGAETDDDVQKIQKTMQRAIVGFVIMSMALLILQVITSALGLGSVFDLATFSDLLPGEQS